jgi:hypothetical protein
MSLNQINIMGNIEEDDKYGRVIRPGEDDADKEDVYGRIIRPGESPEGSVDNHTDGPAEMPNKEDGPEIPADEDKKRQPEIGEDPELQEIEAPKENEKDEMPPDLRKKIKEIPSPKKKLPN